jgi:hypothetical protein
VARTLVAGLVLAGLLLMHGLATLDCHSAASDPAGSAVSAMAEMMPMPGPMHAATGAPVGTTAGVGQQPQSNGDPGTGGTGVVGGVCIATPPTSGLAGLIAALLLAFGVAVLAGRSRPDATIAMTIRSRAPTRPTAGVRVGPAVDVVHFPDVTGAR